MADAIPTRMSTLDHRYDSNLAQRLIVNVDDVEQEQVISYDVEEGVVVRYLTVGGEVVVNRDTGDLITEEVRGEVVVVLKPI